MVTIQGGYRDKVWSFLEMKIIAAQFYMRNSALNEEPIEDLLKNTSFSDRVCQTAE
jgi:hypothetical protein